MNESDSCFLYSPDFLPKMRLELLLVVLLSIVDDVLCGEKL